jgi:alkanesulfonate monooxygenase SsuD/methylene tetrahydromethanopterin reductase-like flavin-dependent oxidoreductase (luciferase family)
MLSSASMPDEAIDLEYLVDNLWFVGSPQTVADRILELQEQTGGFGHLLIVSYDASNERESWDRSLRLLMDEVLPRCQASTRLAQSGAEGPA